MFSASAVFWCCKCDLCAFQSGQQLIQTTHSTTISQPPDGEGHSLGRRRVARTHQPNQTPTAPLAANQTPTAPLAANQTPTSSMVHAVSTTPLSVKDTQLNTVFTISNSSRKMPAPSTKTPRSKSSFQSPLDQILVDQSRMFVQSSVHNVNVPTQQMSTNVQFCPQPIAINSSSSKAVLPASSVANVTASSVTLSSSSGSRVQPITDSLQSLSSSAVAPNDMPSEAWHSTTAVISASVSETSVADHGIY